MSKLGEIREINGTYSQLTKVRGISNFRWTPIPAPVDEVEEIKEDKPKKKAKKSTKKED